jgi:hypothetical protein
MPTQSGDAVGTLQAMSLTIKLVFAAGAVAALAWFVFRPLYIAWQQQPDPESLMPKLPPLPEGELQIPVDPNDASKPTREQMIAKVRSDPRQTALLLQQWIRTKKDRRPS